MKILGLTLVVGFLTACSQGGSGAGGNDPTAQGEDPAIRQFRESYQLRSNGCDTGKHVFDSNSSYEDVKKQLCGALQDDELNSSCAEPLRRDLFDKKCSGMAWNPKYKPVAPVQPNPTTPNINVDYATQEKVRSTLANVLVEKYEVATALAGQEKQSTVQFSEDMMSCGLSYLGPKCLDFETLGGSYLGVLSVDGKYVFYSELKIKGASALVAMVFKIDQVQPSVKVSEAEILKILKPRSGQSVEQYLKDTSALSSLAKITLEGDFQTASTKRLQSPRDVRELYHVGKMVLEAGMNTNNYQAARTSIAKSISKNKALIIQTEDVRYQEEILFFITSEIDLKKNDLIEICDGLLNSQSENVKQIAATIVFDAQPDRTELKPIVLKALKNSRWDIRSKAISGLSKVSKTKSEENQLISMIDDVVSVVSDAAVAAVKSFTVDEGNLSTIEDLVSSQNWAVRKEAARLLNRVNTDKSIKSLIAMMDDAVSVVQDEVFKLLEKKTLNDSFVVDLEEQMKSSDWSVRKNTTILLSKINTDLSNTKLINYLNDSVSVVEDLIFEKLKVKSLKKSYLPALVQNFSSQNWSVRNRTSILIGKISGTSAANALIAQMDDSVSVVQDTIQTLLMSRSLTADSVEPLANKFTSQNWQVRMHVAQLLGKIKTTSSKDALEEQLLKEGVSVVKDQIIASIKAIKN